MRDIAATFFDNPAYLTQMMLVYLRHPLDQIDLQNEIIDRLYELKQYDNLEYVVKAAFSHKRSGRIASKIFEKLNKVSVSKTLVDHILLEKSICDHIKKEYDDLFNLTKDYNEKHFLNA